MKIGLVSDSHDNRGLLAAAVNDARHRGAQVILHAGDVVAPSTLSALRDVGIPVHVIHGNNAGDLVTLSQYASRAGNPIQYHGQDAALTLAGRRIFVVHYPHYARAMALTGDWDLVCYGHDHVANIEALTNMAGGLTLLANPGSVAGLDGPATYILGDLATMELELLPVPGRQA
jgi:putative phosphoesterase